VVNGVVGDPFARLQREAARGLGYARPEDIQLRYVPRRFGGDALPNFRAAWDVALELSPDAVEWTNPADVYIFAVRARGDSAGGAMAPAPLRGPPPQRVDAVMPSGMVVRAAFSHAAADPLADLIESVANAGRDCTDGGLELRAVTGALPQQQSQNHALSEATVRELWERGSPLFRDVMPAAGQAVVARFVDVPGLPPPGQGCGTCLW
jgi:hypothetical protein